MYTRQQTRSIKIGNQVIGGNSPILIQSMTNTKTEQVEATVDQIRRLEQAGCDIVRLAIPTKRSSQVIDKIKNQVTIPLVADIHYDYRLALECIDRGIDKIRLNPGNIGDRSRVEAVVKACAAKQIPIRIGVNSGSVEKEILAQYGRPTAEALVASALYHIQILEELDFHQIVVSIKSSDVLTGVKAYELMAEHKNYPLHLGVTEAGTLIGGTVKSSVGLGIMLDKGLGDTIRVSLTDDPVEEIKVAKKILGALNLGKPSIEIVSCPTCGRTSIDLIAIAKEVERRIGDWQIPLKIAVMGCSVNGPGEAKEADFGIAGGNKQGIIFQKGKIIKKCDEVNLVDELLIELNKYRLASQDK